MPRASSVVIAQRDAAPGRLRHRYDASVQRETISDRDVAGGLHKFLELLVCVVR